MESEFVAYALRQLQVLGPVAAKRMFGGHGLYLDETFFALIDGDALYFKVDELTRPAYITAGMGPFVPPRGAKAMGGYFELPLDVLETPAKLKEWGAKALAVARAAAEGGSRGRPRARAGSAAAELKNLGPVSRRWLADAGIRTRAELQRCGSVGAFHKVAEAGHKPSANLLYALEGALLDLRWDRLSAEVKRNLLARAGLATPKSRKRAKARPKPGRG